MDIQSIFNAGGTVIKNPNYKKGKNNNQPEYITVSDLDAGAAPDGSLVAGIAYDAASRGQQAILGRNGELDKYINAGLTPNGWENLDKELADSQSAMTKLGNSIVQTVASEIALGTVKGISDLFDLIGQATTLSSPDYTNPVSQTLENWQEAVKNYAPIYTDPNINISNGGLLDVGWWASNLPSVMSSLTLLIPSTGVVKGLSYVGKAFNVGSRTSKAVSAISGATRKARAAQAAKAAGKSAEEIAEAGRLNRVQRFLTSPSTAKQTSLLLENSSIATLSRAIENYQEARQTYNDMYAEASDYFKNISDEEYAKIVDENKNIIQKEGIDPNDKDAVAAAIAKASADRTFQMDWMNVGFDIIQMYGLRNAWKGISNAPISSAKVRRANLDQAKYFGKTEAEIKALKKARGFKEKAAEWAEDKLYASKFVIGAQLSEGAEEAINYVAQQEGMHFGNVLLGKETGSKKEGFWNAWSDVYDTRLADYIKAPELWDSAFWGVMGGIVFQGLGSKFNQIKNKLSDKSEASEEAKANLPWYKLDELPEIKRRLADIHSRKEYFDDYKEKLDKINKNIDIEQSTEDKEVYFQSDAEQDAAREKLRNDYIANMTLRAMRSGNLDLLKAYLANDNVRKGMVEAGMFGEHEANMSASEIEDEMKRYSNDVLRKVEEVERMYEEELVAVNDMAASINSGKSYKNQIDADYIQIIATNNIHARLGLRNSEIELSAINDRISQLESLYYDKLDHNIDHSSNIRLGILAKELGKLRAKRRKLLEQEDNKLSTTIAIHNIDKQIDEIEDKLNDAELQWATFQSLRYTIDDKGEAQQGIDINAEAEAFAYRDAMIIQATEDKVGHLLDYEELNKLNLSKRARTQLDMAGIGRYNTLEQDTQNSFREVHDVCRELDNLYQLRAVLEIRNDFYRGRISRTYDEVAYEAGVLHNTMNEARKQVINEAYDVIAELYNKYGSDIERIINAEIYNGYEKYSKEAFENIPKRDRDKLKFYLDALSLSQAHNKSLGWSINARLRKEDALKRNDIDEKGEKNTTVLDNDTDTSTGNLNNSSTDITETPTSNENGQIDDISDNIDPQQTENRIPTYYAKFYDKRGKLQSKHHSNTDNNGVAVYDNGDGTFTIDVRDDAKMKHDTRMFSNANSVDITRPNKVVRKPIARRNKKGKLEIVEKGELVNTDTVEYQEQQAQQEQQVQQEQQAQGEPQQEQVSTQTDNNEQAVKGNEQSSSDNLPTGEVEKQGEQPSQTTTEQPAATPKQELTKPKEEQVDIIFDQAPQEDVVRNAALAEILNAYKADKSANLDEVAKQLIEDQIKQGVDRNIAEPAVNKALDTIKRLIERRIKAKEQNFNSSVDELIISQSTMLTSGRNKDAVTAYQNAVKTMISYYAKEFGLNQINGKYYINLENLLRYVNQSAKDTSLANALYYSLKAYLTSKEGKQYYSITDSNIVTREEAISNIAKSRLQRLKEKLDVNREYRVDLKTILQKVENDDELKEIEEAFNSLNIGDNLTFKIVDSNLVIFAPNGKKVGTMSIPKIGSNSGSFINYQSGWKYDLIKTNGEVKGNIRELLSQWLYADSGAAKELSDIVKELAYGNPSNERKQELYKQFEANEEFRRAKALGLVSNKASIKKLANGLTGIWKYVEIDETAPKKIQEIDKRESINSWFKKLYNDYSTISQIAKGREVNMTVSTLSEGEMITINPDEALPASKALAGGINLDTHKVIIGNPRIQNDVIVSGKGHTSGINIGQGNTAVLLPTFGGKVRFAQAYPSEVTDEHLGQDAKEIVQAVHDEIDMLIKDFRENPSEESFDNLKSFIEQITSNDRGISNLFRGLYFTERNKGTDKHFFSFGILNPNNTKEFLYEIKFFKKSNRTGGYSTLMTVTNPEFNRNAKGRRELNFKEEDKAGKRYLHELINNLSFWVDASYLDSDNVANKPLNGIGSRSNGKFTIKIGDKTWTYDSYNEFLLTNDILKLTTKPNEDGTSNFRKRGEVSQRNNAQLKVNITDKTSTPVEKDNTDSTNDDKTTQPIAGLSVSQKVNNILNSNSENKGIEIVESVLGTIPNIDENVIKSFKDLGILPKNIIFDENFNAVGSRTETINASINISTGVVTVGKQWLDLFNNPSTRGRAIRILIHEQLHNKLRRNKGYVRSAQNIYDEFKSALENGTIKGNRTSEELNHLKEYLFEKYEDKDKALEEFLVESLTNEELARALNDIDAVVPTKRGKNLFQKILELMSKVFGWDVRKGSLYEKELKTLRNLGKTTNKAGKTSANHKAIQLSIFENENDTLEESKAKTEAAKVVDKIHEDGKKVNLTEDEVYYLNEETNTLGVRVTTAIQADEENVKEITNEDGSKQLIPKRFDKNSPWITPSTNIGTGIDEFTRDFFLGKLDNLSDEELEAAYPNVTGQDWARFRDELKEFKNNLLNGKTIKGKHITIVSRDIKAVGQVNVTMPDGSIKKLDVAGTLDLLGYDQDGKFYVFDMKTVRSDNYLDDKEKTDKWNRQLQLYKQFLQDRYNIEVAGTYIIPIKVNYDTPLGATYKDGSDMGGTAEYSVKNPELKTQYDNPNRSQILQDGVEFRDAAPELREILAENPHEGNIKYEYLDDAAKAILDGTVTAENYKQQQPTEEIEKPIDINEEVKEDTVAEDEFAQFEDDGSFDDFDSSVTEITSKQENDYTPEMQSIKDKAIANGTFMKAPNGNPTNLNERQWLQVRTKAFKDWFGDWESSEFINKIDNIEKRITDDMEWSDIVDMLVNEGILERGYWGILGREIVMANINGIKIPFYRSNNGTSNKKAGKWYQFFGFGNADSSSKSNDWFIKGSNRNNNEIENGYGSVDIQRLTKLFNDYLNWTGRHDDTMNMHSVYDFTEKGIDGGTHFHLGEERTDDINEILYGDKNISLTGKEARKALDERIQKIKNNSKNNASKVVDENGEPLVVYHGNRTDNKITTFDPSKKGTEHKERAISGFWFTTDKDIAKEEYALKPESKGKGIEYLQYGEVIPVFLNIKNPIETEQQGITVNDTPYGILTTAKEKLNDFIDRSKALTRENTDGYILTLVDSDNRADDFVSKQTQLVVNNPNQIKSATDNTGEFSTTNDDIRYSSVTELPSIPAFAERLPIAQQAKFGSLVASAEISTSCR